MKSNLRNLKLLIVIIFVLNDLDAILTWISIQAGTAYEVNLLPLYLIEKGPYYFFITKFVLVSAGLALLYIRADEGSVRFIGVLKIIAALFVLVILLGSISVAMALL